MRGESGRQEEWSAQYSVRRENSKMRHFFLRPDIGYPLQGYPNVQGDNPENW
jgi:hypothetical protein